MLRPGRTLALLVSLAVAACEVISGPGGYDLPEEDRSLNPARVRVGYEIYYCGDWNRTVGRPGGNALFADVFFSGGPEEARLDHPLAVHRHIVQQAGGTVVRTYRAPGFRVWIATDSIPKLYARKGVSIRSVPDARRYDLRAVVFYGGPNVFGRTDSLRVTELGGVVAKNFENLGLVILHLPERSLQQIRNDPRVQFIEIGPDFLCPR